MTEKKDLPRYESGATTVEYALILAGVAVAIAALIFTFGGDITSHFSSSEPAAIESTESDAPAADVPDTQAASEAPVAPEATEETVTEETVSEEPAAAEPAAEEPATEEPVSE